MNTIRRLSATISKTPNFPFRMSNITNPTSPGRAFSIFRSLHYSPLSSFSIKNNAGFLHPNVAESGQQSRGIRVRVLNGKLEQAAQVLERKLKSSGMDRLFKRAEERIYHLKNSEKRILAKKKLERRLRSEDFFRKLRSVVIKKLRGQ